ncbi:hypothetical protein M5K25_022188 [Dendrobium thyrsiflorum]|uniref:Uncharacterized protein n=1 Tax=Dendrobium thyrsiflorum TaxID=117978 RepID=A0ABD0UC04_DENTH
MEGSRVEVMKSSNEADRVSPLQVDGFLAPTSKGGEDVNPSKENLSPPRADDLENDVVAALEVLDEEGEISLNHGKVDLPVNLEAQDDQAGMQTNIESTHLHKEEKKASLYLKEVVKNNNVFFLSILETKISSVERRDIDLLVGVDWDFFQVPSEGLLGSILVIWNSRIASFQVLDSSSQYVIGDLEVFKKGKWRIASVYANKDVYTRRRLWDNLEGYSSNDLPMVVGGDFNCLSKEDKKGGRRFRYSIGPKEMNNFISMNDLHEVSFIRSRFTWCNNKVGTERILERLDRCFVNSMALNSSHRLVVRHLARIASDHNPIVLNLLGFPSPCKRVFKFENVWTLNPGSAGVVKRVWMKKCLGSYSQILSSKMRKSLKALFYWSKSKQKNLSVMKDILLKEIEQLQGKEADGSGLSEDECWTLKVKVGELNSTLAQLDTWWRLCTCLKEAQSFPRKWILMNIPFSQYPFLAVGAAPVSHPTVLEKSAYRWSASPSRTPKKRLLDHPLRHKHRDALSPTTIYGIWPKKQAKGRKLPSRLASSHSTFRSKRRNFRSSREGTSEMERSRRQPGSRRSDLCNLCTSTANELLMLLPLKCRNFRSNWKGKSSQGLSRTATSEPGRSTGRVSNGGASEVRSLQGRYVGQQRQRAKVKWMAKGDYNSKFFHSFASARRNSNFIFKIKDDRGFTVEDQHSIENVMTQFFKLKWSNRPCSLYGWPQPWACLDESDRMSLSKPWTGLSINVKKTCLLFGKAVNRRNKKSISKIMQFKSVKELDYLGVKLSLRRLRKDDFQFITDKAIKLTNIWGSKIISLAGKILLIKSVLLSLTTFHCTNSLVPKSILDGIDKICRSFIWNKSDGRLGIHFVNWNAVCLPIKWGGRALHSCSSKSGPLRAKIAWKYTNERDSLLHKIIFPKYGSCLKEGSYKNSSSPAWKILTEGGKALRPIVRWGIANGKYVDVFNDTWPTFVIPLDSYVSVDKLIDSSGWNREEISKFMGSDLVKLVCQNHIHLEWEEDTLELLKQESGKSITAISFEASPDHKEGPIYWNWIKKAKLKPRVEAFWWRLFNNAIPSFHFLFHRRLYHDDGCPRRCNDSEDMDHVTFKCKKTERSFGISCQMGWLSNESPFLVNLYCNVVFFTWKSRNKLIHNGSDDSSLVIAISAINFASFSAIGIGRDPAGIGGVFRDHKGRFLLAFGKTCVHWDVDFLELSTILYAKEILKDWMFKYKGIVIEEDNTNIINFIQKANFASPSIMDESFTFRDFDHIIFNCIDRSCNKLADLCANYALISSFIWEDVSDNKIPPNFMSLVKEESSIFC